MQNSKLFNRAVDLIARLIRAIELFSPFGVLALRLWMANIFFASGLLKLPAGFLGIGKGNWDSTIYLFTSEHPVPGLSPEIAAYMGTGTEIIGALMLVIGFGGRVAAVAFMVMTAVIHFTYQMDPEHIAWAIMLYVIFVQGSGKISIDHLLRKAWMKD